MTQDSANKPTNLRFLMTNVSNPHENQGTWAWGGPCYSPGNHSYREWAYSTRLVINSSTLTNNSAWDNGGAMAIINVNATIRRSNVVDNSAAALAMLRGSTRLRIDDSTFNGNGRSESGRALRATVVHSVSSGALEIAGTSRLEFSNSGIGDIATEGSTNGQQSGHVSPLGHFFLDEGGKISFGNRTHLQCPVGQLMLNNISQMAGVLGDWRINCSALLAIPNTTEQNGQQVVTGTLAAFAQPTCYQLCPLGNTGNTGACGNGCVCRPCCGLGLREGDCDLFRLLFRHYQFNVAALQALATPI